MTDSVENPTKPPRPRVSLWAIAMAFVFAACFASPILLSRYRTEPGDPLLTVINRSGVLSGHKDDALRYEFELTNVSQSPLRILGTQSSCGCTAVTDELPISLAAGQHTTLTVRLVLGETEGSTSRTVRLLVNRSGNVPLLTVTANTLH